MSKVIVITENQMRTIIDKMVSTKKNISEDTIGDLERQDAKSTRDFDAEKRLNNIANIYSSVKKVGNDLIIQNPNSTYNNSKWVDYMTAYNVTPDDINAVKSILNTRKTNQDTQNKRYRNIANIYSSVDQDGIIQNPSSSYNGKSWFQFIKDYNITQDEINNASAYVKYNPEVSPTDASGSDEESRLKARQHRAQSQRNANAKGTEKIKNIQRDLKSKGYDLGTSGPNKDGIDGIWGSKTKLAYDTDKKGGSPSTQKPVDDNLKPLRSASAPIPKTTTNIPSVPNTSNIKVGGVPTIKAQESTPEQIYAAVYDKLKGEEGGNRIKYKGEDLDPANLQKLDQAMTNKGYQRTKQVNKSYGEKYVWVKQ